jgi:hypothetical protein
MTGTYWLRNTLMLLGFSLSPLALAAADASILEMTKVLKFSQLRQKSARMCLS